MSNLQISIVFVCRHAHHFVSANIVWVVLLFINRVWWDLINVLLAWHVYAVHTLTHIHTDCTRKQTTDLLLRRERKKNSMQWIINAIFTVCVAFIYVSKWIFVADKRNEKKKKCIFERQREAKVAHVHVS